MINNQKAADYFEKEAFALIEILETIQINYPKQTLIGSFAEKHILKLNNVKSYSLVQQGLDIMECESNNNCIGFTKDRAARFDRLVRNIIKEDSIKNVVSYSFLKQSIFKWMANVKRNAKSDESFITFLTSKIQESTIEYNIYYLIQFLEIEKPLKIGKVEIGFFTKEFFEGHTKKNPNRPESSDNFWQRYSGRVYAKYNVKAESDKAKEIAFQECALSVDILKLFSHTLISPFQPCQFDMERRSIYNTHSETISEPLKSELQLNISLDVPHRPFELNESELERINKSGLPVFSSFLEGLGENKTELQNIIIDGIQRFANSLYKTNVHERIVDIFSILEALLLVSETSVITETVCTYFSKLICETPDERKELINRVKSMYKVRSKYIHHAKKVDFKVYDLATLQIDVVELLKKLIRLSSTHENKETIMKEIDERIIAA